MTDSEFTELSAETAPMKINLGCRDLEVRAEQNSALPGTGVEEQTSNSRRYISGRVEREAIMLARPRSYGK